VTKWLSGPPTQADYDPNQVDFYITEVAADDGDSGEFVFHCHILEHEDNGMMSKFQVVAD
jgi:FtsP/CotA-like multicopper oxidase with cupredoxin domain